MHCDKQSVTLPLDIEKIVEMRSEAEFLLVSDQYYISPDANTCMQYISIILYMN